MITKAPEAAKRARSRGVDVRPARPVLKECMRAFMAGDHDEAMRLAEDVFRRFTGIPESPRG